MNSINSKTSDLHRLLLKSSHVLYMEKHKKVI